MFFYELTLQRALNGIDATAMMPTILNIANAVLLACLLFGTYQAWARGGDSRLLERREEVAKKAEGRRRKATRKKALRKAKGKGKRKTTPFCVKLEW